MPPELANTAGSVAFWTRDASWTVLQLSGLLWALVQLALVALALLAGVCGTVWGLSLRLRRRRRFSRTRGCALLEAALCLLAVGMGGYWAGTSDLDRGTRDALDGAAPWAALAALGLGAGVYRWRSRSRGR